MYILIDSIRTNADLGLTCTDLSVSAPAPKINLLEIRGRDGSIDLTETVSGTVNYENRELRADFYSIGGAEDYWKLTTRLMALQGRSQKLTLSTDAGFYYTGRPVFETALEQRNLIRVTLTANVQPYKYKQDLTKRVVTVTSGQEENFENLFAPAHPVFTTSDTLEVEQDGVVSAIAKGGVTVPSVVFLKGTNHLKFYGSGTVSVEWREGTL